MKDDGTEHALMLDADLPLCALSGRRGLHHSISVAVGLLNMHIDRLAKLSTIEELTTEWGAERSRDGRPLLAE